ncbi:MAG TPA: ferritin family protein [Candidatus Bathyarchaeia archaeon]|nr:ferritin family protein [Candidatus Bathyarchaeia archaeon]
MEERLKALEIAIKLEEDGKRFYTDASEKATSTFAKDIFGSLAKDEEVHLEKVKEIYDKLKEERAWPKVVTSIGDVVKTKAVFPTDAKDLNMTEEEISESVNVLKTGIEMEEKSITFYNGLAEKATDHFETRFFIALAHEERGHYLSLWDYREYLEDPAGWFGMKEGFRLDGG